MIYLESTSLCHELYLEKKSCVLLLLKELNYTHTCDVALDVCIYYDQGLGFLCNLILLFCQCFGYTYHLSEAHVFKNCI